MARLFDTGIYSVNATDGSVGVGYKLNFYITGTSTRKATYPTRADANALTNANANPVLALADGRFPPIWFIDGDYKAVLTDAAGTVLGDPKDPADSDISSDLASSAGSLGVGFIQSGTGAVAATVQSKARQVLNAADFTGFDATGLTASTTAISNAISEASTRGRTDVLIPKGAKTGALTLPEGVGLIGPETRATLIAAAGNYVTLTVSGSDVAIRNLEITETGKSSGATILIACGTTAKNRIDIDNIVTYDSYGFLTDSGSGPGTHTTTRVKRSQARTHRGHGIALTRLFAFGKFTEIAIDYVGVSASNFTGFSLDGTGLGGPAGGCILDDFDVLGTSGVYTNTSQIGYSFSNTAAIRLRNVRADTCDSNGFVFDTVNGLFMDDVTASLCNGHGMSMTAVTAAVGSKIVLLGRNYLTSPAASKDGLRFVSGCTAINLGNILSRDFTQHGVHKVAAQTGAILLTGLSSFTNTGRGVKSVGDSAFNIIGAQFAANTAGNYDLGGATDYISGHQLASGVVPAAAGPGPITA